MKTSYTKLLAGAAALGLFVAAPAMAGPGSDKDHKNKLDNSSSDFTRACDDDELQFIGDQKLWPPNHKYATYTLIATDTNNDDSTFSLTTQATHDQYVADFLPEEGDSPPDEENGAGQTSNDASPFWQMTADDDDDGEIVQTVKLRAERSGRFKDGRHYGLRVTLNTDNESCTWDGTYQDMDDSNDDVCFEIVVPHDMRGGVNSHNTGEECAE